MKWGFLVVLSVIIGFISFQWNSIVEFIDPSKLSSTEADMRKCLSKSHEQALNERQLNLSSFSLDYNNADLPYECLFSSSFFEAQALFKASSRYVRGSQKLRLPVSDENINLCNDIVVIPGNKKRYLIHISGTHGAEGYAGSAIQSAILQYLSGESRNKKAENVETSQTSLDSHDITSEPDSPTIILVHALNPIGFAKNRRVNEDNIDLNRNFLKEKEFQTVRNRDPDFAGYVTIDDIINPTSKPFKNVFLNDAYSIYLTVTAVIKHGMLNMKKAMVSGNYYKSKGLGFGGYKLSRSGQNLINLMHQLNIHETAEKIVFIDVHTGLGPSGQDTLMIGLNDYTDDEKAVVRELFPADINTTTGQSYGGIMENFVGSNLEGASSGYELTVVSYRLSVAINEIMPNLDALSFLGYESLLIRSRLLRKFYLNTLHVGYNH